MKKIDPQQLAMHRKFVDLARQRASFRNQLLAMLPEIYNNGVWRNYSESIFEYAGRYGGISRSAVEKRLKLEIHLAGKPALKAAIAEVGVNKVARLATLATPKTDASFADKALNMSLSAIDTLAKELRKKDDAGKTTNCEAQPLKIRLELDPETSFQFMKLRQKWGDKLSNAQIMTMIMEKIIEQEFTQSANAMVESDPRGSKNAKASQISADHLTEDENDGEAKRYVRAKTKRRVKGGGKCAYKNCNKPGKPFHHTDRLMTSKSHKSLVYLCEDHHEFAHNGLIKNEIGNSNHWQINVTGTATLEADKLYRKYRKQS